MKYDKIILGAGLYGLYSAELCGRRGEKILVLEYDDAAFKRATYINQARVHMGYHYPRSYSTAIKSAKYFERFVADYGFCIHSEFDQVYATSSTFSWTNADQFQLFCKVAGIKCEQINPDKYFNSNMCDGAFLSREYTYDAALLKEYLSEKIAGHPNVEIRYGTRLRSIENTGKDFKIELDDGNRVKTEFLLNCTYASSNQIINMLGYDLFSIKYELCEIIICDVTEKLENTGVTVMDGPFFSIMPFGKTGYHSLTSVTFTPHSTSYDALPNFKCQIRSNGYCTSEQLGNCNDCPERPKTAWAYMNGMARKFLRDELKFDYVQSLFSIKPILKTSEIDDSRPTLIRVFSNQPTFISVLSGKINTVYDLDEVLSK